MRACPRCEIKLITSQVGPFNVEGCHSCGGVWFENGELNQIAHAGAIMIERTEDAFLEQNQVSHASKEMHCSTCSKALYHFEFPYALGIPLMACPDCKGIWFDDGELHALYLRIRGAAANQADRTHDQRARHAFGIMKCAPCPKCSEQNPCLGVNCWACSHRLLSICAPHCPNCHAGMDTRRIHGLEVEICSACAGIWLDAGEISQLNQITPQELIEIGLHHDRPSVSASWNENPAYLCPVCALPMVTREYANNVNESVDTCDACGGVWIGSGKAVLFSKGYTRTLGRESMRLG